MDITIYDNFGLAKLNETDVSRKLALAKEIAKVGAANHVDYKNNTKLLFDDIRDICSQNAIPDIEW